MRCARRHGYFDILNNLDLELELNRMQTISLSLMLRLLTERHRRSWSVRHVQIQVPSDKCDLESHFFPRGRRPRRSSGWGEEVIEVRAAIPADIYLCNSIGLNLDINFSGWLVAHVLNVPILCLSDVYRRWLGLRRRPPKTPSQRANSRSFWGDKWRTKSRHRVSSRGVWCWPEIMLKQQIFKLSPNHLPTFDLSSIPRLFTAIPIVGNAVRRAR